MTATAVYTHHRNFVAPLSEFDSGRKMFRTGTPLESCATDEAARGWLAAEDQQKIRNHQRLMQSLQFEPSIEDDYEWIRRGC